MIGIVDYNAGNITSVQRALNSLGIKNILSKNPEELKNCDKLIFPGVGDAAYAMVQLKETGFDSSGRKRAAEIAKTLENNGIACTVRRELGAGIDGACGQLRLKTGAKNG